ncbi:unnamed protein product [Boreogadus saida]
MGLVLLLGVCVVARLPWGSAAGGPPAEPRCIKVNSCKCIMEDGTGVINLDGVGDRGGFLRPVPRPPVPRPPGVRDRGVRDQDLLLALSPCRPLVKPWELAGTPCSRAAACLIARWAWLESGGRGSSQVGVARVRWACLIARWAWLESGGRGSSQVGVPHSQVGVARVRWVWLMSGGHGSPDMSMESDRIRTPTRTAPQEVAGSISYETRLRRAARAQQIQFNGSSGRAVSYDG